MTIGPKKKISQSKGRKRHSTWETLNIKRIEKTYATGKCPNCGATKLNHRVCQVCGYYKGKQVVTKKVAKKEKVIDA